MIYLGVQLFREITSYMLWSIRCIPEDVLL